MQKICWLDIATLTVIQEFYEQHGHPPSRSHLWASKDFSLINEWLEKHRIPAFLCPIVKSNRVPSKSIKALREAGFLPAAARSQYFVTDSGLYFLISLAATCSAWPLSINVYEGKADFPNAIYAIDGLLSVRTTHNERN